MFDLYAAPTWLLCVILFVAVLGLYELGHRIGAWHQDVTSATIKPQTAAIQGSVLGLLALLLGFTFSMSVARHDQRSQAVVAEANAIGTAQLRVSLVPPERRDDARDALQRYAVARLGASEASIIDATQRDQALADAAQLQQVLWEQAATLSRDATRPAFNLYIAALNDMFDAQTSRAAAVERHVPMPVVILLLCTLLAVTMFAGYNGGLDSGGDKARPWAAATLFSVLVVLVVYMILDLDRPRRGMIQVDQSSLYALVEGVPQAADQADSPSR